MVSDLWTKNPNLKKMGGGLGEGAGDVSIVLTN